MCIRDRYKNAPRLQTSIAVRAGSKHDPSDATGLAHYLEHMLFKGTDKYGTINFIEEKPLLDKIEDLYEEYRKVPMSNISEREKIWNKIDSLSNEAAKFAIANEYDKMVSGIGAKGTNAYTSNEKTVYINDIPSNQIEKWLKLESERFRAPIFRLFHTELETVYEEKNRGLDDDGRKLFYEMLDAIFPNHQYGQQTTIGTIKHLKNPSLKEIQKYYDKYYVPNNMAICISGDFESERVIELIDKYLNPKIMKLEQQTNLKDKKKIIYILGMQSGSPLIAGKNTSGNGLINISGGINPLASFDGWKPVGTESIIEAAPDLIIISERGLRGFGTLEDLRNHPALYLTPAAKKKLQEESIDVSPVLNELIQQNVDLKNDMIDAVRRCLLYTSPSPRDRG